MWFKMEQKLITRAVKKITAFNDEVDKLINQGWFVYPESLNVTEGEDFFTCACVLYRSNKEYDRNYGDCNKKPQ
jgi:hypothetical protein